MRNRWQVQVKAAARQRPISVQMALTVAGAVSLALLSQVSIPLQPVPVTLQVLGVLLLGCTLGPWFGAMAVVEYLLLGLLGAPVFSGAGSGPAFLFGPHGGYLLAFPLAAGVSGLLYQHCNSDGRFWRVLSACGAGFTGVAVIYLGGWAWLTGPYHLGALPALAVGVTPFILLDFVKAIVVALTMSSRGKE